MSETVQPGESAERAVMPAPDPKYCERADCPPQEHGRGLIVSSYGIYEHCGVCGKMIDVARLRDTRITLSLAPLCAEAAAEIERLLAERDAARTSIAALKAALLVAAGQFARYADYHLAKVPPDRDAAATNVEWAARCRAALVALADATEEKK